MYLVNKGDKPVPILKPLPFQKLGLYIRLPAAVEIVPPDKDLPMHDKHVQMMHQQYEIPEPALLVLSLLSLEMKVLYFRLKQEYQLHDRLVGLEGQTLLARGGVQQDLLELGQDFVLLAGLDQLGYLA